MERSKHILEGLGNQYYRAAKDVMKDSGHGEDPTADYAALGFSYNNKKWTNVGLAYHYLKSKTFGYYAGYAGSAANYSANDASDHPLSYKEDQIMQSSRCIRETSSPMVLCHKKEIAVVLQNHSQKHTVGKMGC